TQQTEVFDVGPSQTSTLTLAKAPSGGVATITLNGNLLAPATDYTIAGSKVTLTPPRGGTTTTETIALNGDNAASAVQLQNPPSDGTTSVFVTNSQFFNLKAAPAGSVTVAESFVAGSVKVFVGGVELSQARYSVSGQTVSFLNASGNPEQRSDA